MTSRLIPKAPQKVHYVEMKKSAGILDDYAVRKNVATKEGTIEHVPTADNHIANKKYVDDNAYTDADAVAAVAAADDYVLNTGDTISGDLTFSSTKLAKFTSGNLTGNGTSATSWIINNGGTGTTYLSFDKDSTKKLTYSSVNNNIASSIGMVVSGNLSCNALKCGYSESFSDSDNLNVGSVNVAFLDTGFGSITIGGFSSGEAGQVLHVIKRNASNNLTLENNEASGTQKIYLSSGGDETLTGTIGGWTLVCDGSAWYEAGR